MFGLGYLGAGMDTLGAAQGGSGWIFGGVSVDLNFANGQYWNNGPILPTAVLTVTRASTGTNLLPTDASGLTYTNFGNNTLRTRPGSGVLIEESRINRLLNSAVPVTQTTASLATGTYTLWVNGSGSATSSAGSATGSSFGAATQGSPNTFTLSVAGTVVITVAGSLNAFQLELGAFGTSLIVTAGATVTRAEDVIVGTGALATALNGSVGSVLVKSINVRQPIANNPRILGRNSGGSAFATWMNFQSTAKLVTYNGATLLSTTNSVTPTGTTRGGFSWTASARNIAANGTTAATDANAPSLTAVVPQLGGADGDALPGEVICGYLARLAAFTTTLSAATIASQTGGTW